MERVAPPQPRSRRRVVIAGCVLLGLLLLLLIPEARPGSSGAGSRSFAWDQDGVWRSLEERFAAQRERPEAERAAEAQRTLAVLSERIAALEAGEVAPQDPSLVQVEKALLAAAGAAAAAAAPLEPFAGQATRLRRVVKERSRAWDLGQRASREKLYRLLYASRLALEGLILQLPPDAVAPRIVGTDEPSACPSAEVEGVRIHSGDLLVSRGGAPTSALIARGSDFPGNFSHVALVHVSEQGEVLVIESLIESGVVVNSAAHYLEDKKLRVMVLRPRADLPQLLANPRLPHEAASAALREAQARHIPYDFAMDHADPSKQFCSEVASQAYGAEGVSLWQGLTTMSDEGLVRWLGAFGVTHFETHGPSDLEYDPQLRVVAEWRGAETLWQDHVDNAVVDALLEGAEAGEEVGHAWYLLPLARVVKGASVLLNLLGTTGPIPEGMSATKALRAKWLEARHGAVKAETLSLAATFEKEKGYRPPYWELVALARQAKGGR